MTVSTELRQYRLCGLIVASTIPLPELTTLPAAPSAQAADIHFEIIDGMVPPDQGRVVLAMTSSDGALWLSCAKAGGDYHLRFPGLADFLVSVAGNRAICIPAPDTPPETIRHLFLDHVMPLILNLLGREALHASGILTPRGVCAFIGETGLGKSTLAAAFHVAGYPVLSDDCLVLSERQGRILAEPAYPGLRLWDDVVKAFYGDNPSFQPVSHYTSKQRVATRIPEHILETGHPLTRVYSLVRSDELAGTAPLDITPFSLRDAMMQLITVAFRLDLTDRAMILRQMRMLERVARHVPVKRLRFPDDLSLLPRVRELIMQDMSKL